MTATRSAIWKTVALSDIFWLRLWYRMQTPQNCSSPMILFR